MKKFFSKDPEKFIKEIKEELYDRLLRSRKLYAIYDLDIDNHDYYGLGYPSGVQEEIIYLEKLMDTIERS